MKAFNKTKFGSFLTKVGSTGLDIISILGKAKGGNIIGAINETKSLLTSSTSKDSLSLLGELNDNENDFISDYDKYLEDIKDARNMYIKEHEVADKIATKIIRENLPTIGGLIILNVGAVWLLEGKGEIIAIVSNFIGIAIGHLFNERQSVINFFFGSSKGSKDKSTLLNK